MVKVYSHASGRFGMIGLMQTGHAEKRVIRIAIDCRIPNARQGHGAAIRGLAHALSGIKDHGQEYTFLVTADLRDWLEPYLRGNCRIAVVGAGQSGWKKTLRSWSVFRWLLGKMPRRIPSVPISDGYVEREGFDIVHFPTQQAYLTKVPSVYQPWDLQHVHYPKFFSTRDLAIRDLWYRAFCKQASIVCVQAEWTKSDVSTSYSVPEDKIVVIPWGSTFEAYQTQTPERLHAIARKLNLPQEYFFYPAVTWPHKNHMVLLQALAILNERYGRSVDLYLSGANTGFRSTLDKAAKQLGVAEQVHWLGFVTTDELQSLFANASAMVFPSLFEGFGLPILEAFYAGLPVISSNATVLPEVAQEAALYFNPQSAEELSERMLQILADTGLRKSLQEKGKQVLQRFSLEVTARRLSELYTQIAQRTSIN